MKIQTEDELIEDIRLITIKKGNAICKMKKGSVSEKHIPIKEIIYIVD